MRKGWFSGSTWTAVPTRSRLVRVAIELAIRSEAEITERDGVKWISPSQTQSMPQASAMSASSNALVERRDRRGAATHLLDEESEVHAGSYTMCAACLAPARNLAYTSAEFSPILGREDTRVSQDKTELVEILRKMILIREFDLLAIELRKAKRDLRRAAPYVGEEAVAVGVCAALRPAAIASPARIAATATASPRAPTSTA